MPVLTIRPPPCPPNSPPPSTFTFTVFPLFSFLACNIHPPFASACSCVPSSSTFPSPVRPSDIYLLLHCPLDFVVITRSSLQHLSTVCTDPSILPILRTDRALFLILRFFDCSGYLTHSRAPSCVPWYLNRVAVYPALADLHRPWSYSYLHSTRPPIMRIASLTGLCPQFRAYLRAGSCLPIAYTSNMFTSCLPNPMPPWTIDFILRRSAPQVTYVLTVPPSNALSPLLFPLLFER